MSRIQVFDRRTRTPIEALTAMVEVDWVLNGIGEMKFSVSVNDPKNVEEILRPGNPILWTHDQLPDWAGPISDDELVWDAENGVVTFTAFSGEGLMDTRETNESVKLKGTGGSLIKQLIKLTNKDEDTGIREGNIQDERTKREETLGDSPLTHAKRISASERANADFYVEPSLSAANQLTFVVNWLNSGSVNTGLMLKEGQHFIHPKLSEQGPIINRVRGLGDAVTKGTRPVYVAEDAVSRATYGLRARSYYYEGNKTLATVRENSMNTLAEMKDWRRYLTLGIVNVAAEGITNVQDIWAMLRLRNAFEVACTSVGYNGARSGFGLEGILVVKAMKYFEASEYVELKGKVI